MIYEFALDPILAAQWSDRREFQRYSGKFGAGTARVMSRVPNKHWRALVWKAFDKLVSDLDAPEKERRRQKLETILLGSLEAGTARRACAADGTWVHCASKEHRRRPFHSLLVASESDEVGSNVPSLRDQDFDEDDVRWTPEHGLVRRQPQAIAAALAPLVSCAREIRLIDPHFDPRKPRWRDTVALLFARAVAQRDTAELPAFEIHTCVSRGRGVRPVEGQTVAEQEERAKGLAADLDALAPHVPAGLTVTTFFWAERVGGVDFHDRYMLTDVGGLTLGKGFDAKDDASSKDETITILPRKLLSELWLRFRAGPTGGAFDQRHAPVVLRAPLRSTARR